MELLISIVLIFTGFVIGLGAVTVIDIHGFLARHSSYWTQATIRTHKITKPLIWIGTGLVTAGAALFYSIAGGAHTTLLIHGISFVCIILNGIFLSFVVSSFLIKREKEGLDKEILPAHWQRKIFFSFILSFVLWWGNLILIAYSIATSIK